MSNALVPRSDRYPAKRRQKEARPMTEPSVPVASTPETPQSPQPAPVELAQRNYELGQVLDLEPDFAAAQAFLASAIPTAEAGLVRRKAWLAAPVVARTNLVPAFSFPSVAELLRLARPQACPQAPPFLWDTFVDWRAKVQGYVEETTDAEEALARLATLTPKDTVRDAVFRALNRWPQDSLVDRLGSAMVRMATGDDRLTDAAHELAVSLVRLLNWSRSVRAQGTPLQAATRPHEEPSEPEPRCAITKFNPFTNQPV